MTAALDALVVGGGQSGLAVGKLLADAGLNLAVADAGAAVGHVWRSRWDSLRLFTPVKHDARPRGSALLGVVGRDAAEVAVHVMARHQEIRRAARRAA